MAVNACALCTRSSTTTTLIAIPPLPQQFYQPPEGKSTLCWPLAVAVDGIPEHSAAAWQGCAIRD